MALSPAASSPSAIEELAARAREGCRASFEALVEHFEKRIFHYLYQMTRNQHDAEDLTQVTFLKAFQNIERYRSGHAFHAWLFTIAKRTALNHFRDERPFEELEPEQLTTAEDPSVLLEKQDAGGEVWRLAQALKPDQFEVLWLRYAEGFSIAETARVMRCSSIRVRVLLHRARNAMAKKLSASHGRNE